MVMIEKEKFSEEMVNLGEKYGRTRNALLPILQNLIESHKTLSDDMIREVADFLGIQPAEVYGVVTFYSFLNPEKRGKFRIYLCQTICCDMQGKAEIAKELEKELGIKFGETTEDGLFSLEYTNCIGMCDQGPALLVNEKVFVKVTPQMIKEIIEGCRLQKKEKLPQSNPINFLKILPDGLFSNVIPESGLKKALSIGRGETIKAITDSGLKGRGGAGFTTGVKWNLTAVAKDPVKFVVCNADEGEPGTFKDRVLLSNYADLVFEGMTIGGYAIGAKKGILYLRGEYRYMLPHLLSILEERRKNNLLGEKILNKEDFSFDIEIKLGSGAYVCGEETALIESLEGKRGEPRNRPPFPVNTGYLGHPTTVNNVETFLAAARILANGAEWFKKFGTEKSSGTKLFSISGNCKHPGVYELPMGIKVSELLKLVGGEDAKAVVIGGASGSIISPKDFERRISYEDLATGGSVMIFGKEMNLLKVAKNFMEFFVEESCGQCTPCRLGNVQLLKGIEMLQKNECSGQYLKQLLSLGETMKLTSKCGLGQSSPNVFTSLVENFPDEIGIKRED